METTVEKLSKDWSDSWSRINIPQEIGTLWRDKSRSYLLKYLPRNGVHLEAGCGQGRYVFYLSDVGFDILRPDVSESGLRECRNWTEGNGYAPDMYKYDDVREIPYPDSYFLSYRSLGVIEHFEEGPYKALEEAFCALRGGGLAIIETPNRYSLEFLHLKILKPFKSVVKFVLTKLNLLKTKGVDQKRADELFQYEYSVKELAEFINNAGFEIIEKRTIDLKYPLYRICKSLQFVSGMRLLKLLKPYIFPVLDRLERVQLSLFGGFSMVIAYKSCEKPHFFFCGEEYRKNVYFEDYSFSVPVCPKYLRDRIKNLELSIFYFKHVWREYYDNPV